MRESVVERSAVYGILVNIFLPVSESLDNNNRGCPISRAFCEMWEGFLPASMPLGLKAFQQAAEKLMLLEGTGFSPYIDG
jgi:hypothetical protein